MLQRIFLTFFLLVLYGCSPASLEEYHFEGESIARELVSDLQKVHTLADLKENRLSIKGHFEEIAWLMIAARKFQMRNPDKEKVNILPHTISDVLKMEMARIYQIDGCKEFIENLQRESLHTLAKIE